jgi:thymidylate synthase (FAD)
MGVYNIELESRLCNEAVSCHVDNSLLLFEDMIKKGVSREQARMILPQNLYTEYYATANLNNILKFIDLRTHEGAQWEIQELAKKILEIIKDLWPESVKSFINN